MESTGKESIVSRLFGFGKKTKKREDGEAAPEAEEHTRQLQRSATI